MYGCVGSHWRCIRVNSRRGCVWVILHQRRMGVTTPEGAELMDMGALASEPKWWSCIRERCASNGTRAAALPHIRVPCVALCLGPEASSLLEPGHRLCANVAGQRLCPPLPLQLARICSACSPFGCPSICRPDGQSLPSSACQGLLGAPPLQCFHGCVPTLVCLLGASRSRAFSWVSLQSLTCRAPPHL